MDQNDLNEEPKPMTNLPNNNPPPPSKTDNKAINWPHLLWLDLNLTNLCGAKLSGANMEGIVC